MLKNNSTCDNCSRHISGDYCSRCSLKCPFCGDILGEEAVDAYNVGCCTHLICLYNPYIDYIIWRNKEYEREFIHFCEALSTQNLDLIVDGEYLLPFESEKSKFDYFALKHNILCIEHNGNNDPLHHGSTYVYIKKESP